MSTDHAPKEAKNQTSRRQEVIAGSESFQIESPAPSLNLTPANVLKLQRTIGNQAVQRLMQQQPAHSEASTERPARFKPALPTINQHHQSAIQRFDTPEHLKLGNDATQGEH